MLHHFHRLELLETRFLGDFILAVIGVVLKVSHIGDVAHIAHLVAAVHEVAVEHIEGDSRARVSQVAVAIHCRTAHIHPHPSFVDGLERLFAACERIVDI